MRFRNSMGRGRVLTMLACLAGGVVFGGVLKEVEFEIVVDVGEGNEVCVTGPHPLLGGGDPVKAPKLEWNEGNVWRGRIALPAGEVVAHRFIKRDFDAAKWGDSTNSENLSGNLTVAVPPHVPPPWSGKTIFLHSTWPSVNLYHRDLTNGGGWTTAPMRRVGAGRSAGEGLFRVDGVAANGAELEFVFTDGAGNWVNAPPPPSDPAQGAAPAVPAPYQGLTGPYNFRTRLDVFFVQDRQVFNYRPPANPSSPYSENRTVGSTATGIPGRPIRIHLPRAYAQNPWKRYPVVYFHDGQNVPFPGGPFGTWDAERIANYEISQGRMRECIIVSIPNGNGYGSNRLEEYLPEGDTIGNYANQSYSGRASAYADFLLNNVVPTLDFNYRTLRDAENTLTVGSSMGGLVSDYLGTSHPDRFGAVGVFSPAYWAAPRYMEARAIPSKKPRVFLSMGTAESSTGESSSDKYWRDALSSLRAYTLAGHASNRDSVFAGVPGGLHNEAAWSRLLPSFYAFALDPRLEANPLLLEHYPPAVSLRHDAQAGGLELRLLRHLGFEDRLLQSDNLRDWSSGELPGLQEFWDEAFTAVPPGNARRFWRIHSAVPSADP